MTDFRRAILLGMLILIGMMLFNAWTAEHPPVQPASTPETTVAASSPNVISPNQAVTTSSLSANRPSNLPALTEADRYIAVKTDTFNAKIDRLGGNIVELKLLKYPVSVTDKNNPITLLNTDPKSFYVAQSGFKNKSLDSNSLVFTLKNQHDNTNQFVLTANTPEGLILTKTYTFPENDYVIRLKQSIQNNGHETLQAMSFATLSRTPPANSGVGPFNFNTYSGGAVSSPEKRYEKISFKEMQNNSLDQTHANGWVAMLQHYFLSAWIPDQNVIYHYQANASDNIYTLGISSQPILLAPAQQYSETQQLYAGPEEADRLAKIAPGLNLTVDYGVLWFIADIIFTVMKKIHSVVGNWGWSIVLVTLFIKILFYKLNAVSFKSMAKMRDIQPKIEQIRERCGDDKQKLAQATMELYRREKVNPMGGCLPLIVQIPVFLSLYWVIIESVELRQAPFILWIHDLSLKDPYYVLPLLMGLTIFIQQMLGPKAPDPMQRKIMMAMPVVFTALFLSFPAGLVLYWVVNNTLSILQQWYIMKHVVKKK